MESLRTRRALTLAGLSLVVVTMLVLNTGMGAVSIPPATVVSLLAERVGLEVGAEAIGVQESVLWSIRFPRIVLGLVVAGALAAAGVGLQAVFRNPLAESQVVGTSWGAAVGAAAALAAGAPATGSFAPAAAAMATALLATFLAYRVARRGPRVEVVTLILAGVAINAIAAAAVGLLVNVAERGQMRSFSFWSLGSLGGATWHTVSVTLVLVIPGVVLLARRGRQLNVLSLGDEEARHSGVDVRRLRVEVVAAAALLTGASVSAAGVIGFVGILAPHTVRMIIGPDNRVLLPGAMLAGAGLLLAADLASRTAVAPAEIPLGVLTSLVGGPFFLWLLGRTRRAQGGWG